MQSVPVADQDGCGLSCYRQECHDFLPAVRAGGPLFCALPQPVDLIFYSAYKA